MPIDHVTGKPYEWTNPDKHFNVPRRYKFKWWLQAKLAKLKKWFKDTYHPDPPEPEPKYEEVELKPEDYKGLASIMPREVEGDERPK
jgi:hypothetical protein